MMTAANNIANEQRPTDDGLNAIMAVKNVIEHRFITNSNQHTDIYKAAHALFTATA